MYVTNVSFGFCPTDFTHMKTHLVSQAPILDNKIDSFIYDNGVLSVITTIELSSQDTEALQLALAGYSNPQIDTTLYLNTGLNPCLSNALFYSTVFAYDYIPNKTHALSRCVISSFMLPNTPNDSAHPDFSYSIRVVDITNNVVLGSVIASNSTEEVHSISLVPVDELQKLTLEIQIKKNNVYGSYVKVLKAGFELEEI